MNKLIVILFLVIAAVIAAGYVYISGSTAELLYLAHQPQNVSTSTPLSIDWHENAITDQISLRVVNASGTKMLEVSATGTVYVAKECVSDVPVTKQQCIDAITKAFAPLLQTYKP
jgi:hypothetical protein